MIRQSSAPSPGGTGVYLDMKQGEPDFSAQRTMHMPLRMHIIMFMHISVIMLANVRRIG